MALVENATASSLHFEDSLQLAAGSFNFVRQYATIADSSKGGGSVFPGRPDAEQ
jgi:hypothetical protein